MSHKDGYQFVQRSSSSRSVETRPTLFSVRLAGFESCSATNDVHSIMRSIHKMAERPLHNDNIILLVSAYKIQFLRSKSSSGGNSYDKKKIRNSIPICDLTLVTQLSSPHQCFVTFVFLVPTWTMEEAACLHVYRCESAEKAKNFVDLVNTAMRPQMHHQYPDTTPSSRHGYNGRDSKSFGYSFNIPTIPEKEDHVEFIGYTPTQVNKRYGLTNNTYNPDVSINYGNSTADYNPNQNQANLLAKELNKKLASKEAIIAPPVDYDTISRSRWNLKTKKEFANRDQIILQNQMAKSSLNPMLEQNELPEPDYNQSQRSTDFTNEVSLNQSDNYDHISGEYYSPCTDRRYRRPPISNFFNSTP